MTAHFDAPFVHSLPNNGRQKAVANNACPYIASRDFVKNTHIQVESYRIAIQNSSSN
jgi:hypothetical protein